MNNDNMSYDIIPFPVHVTSDTLEELATLAQFNLLSGKDLPDDLLDSLINSDNQ